MKAIINVKVILENEIIQNGTIIVKDGTILSVGKSDEIKIPDGVNVIDAKGLYVGPGFVDIHVHAYDGERIYNNPEKASAFCLRHGHTTILSAFYDDMTSDDMIKSYNRIIDARKTGKSSRIIEGIYMEGPYMNAKFGAEASNKKWDRDNIKSEDYTEVVETLGDFAKVWVIAPERDGIEPFVQKIREVNPNAVISIGHSEATIAEIKALKKYEIGLLTHCTNATGRVGEGGGIRRCGPDEYCFLDDSMYAELICDSLGIHVDPDMIKLVLKIKGKDKIVLVSDSTDSNGDNPEWYSHITDLNFDKSGALSGSRITLDAACRNMMKHSGCSITDVFVMASRNPARIIGMDKEIGGIEPGKKANLVFADKEINVKRVMLEGEFMEDDLCHS